MPLKGARGAAAQKYLSTFSPASQLIHVEVCTPEFTLGMTSDVTDQPDALARARRGEEAAFEELMRMHERQVLLTAMRLLGRLEDAQDATQETFLKLYRNLRIFASAAEIGPWLYRVTVNVCRDLARKRGLLAADARWPDVAIKAGEDERIGLERRRTLLAEALTHLPEKERAAIILREIEGLETGEVAGILGSSPATVRTQVSTGRARLRAIMTRLLRRKHGL
jgi:RNA polymerase sigma-70 factor, ECF subfamily